jgi:hypothetical protein
MVTTAKVEIIQPSGMKPVIDFGGICDDCSRCYKKTVDWMWIGRATDQAVSGWSWVVGIGEWWWWWWWWVSQFVRCTGHTTSTKRPKSSP